MTATAASVLPSAGPSFEPASSDLSSQLREDWPQCWWRRRELAEYAHDLPVASKDPDKATLRRRGTDVLLAWLETWQGTTWQDRWEASDSEALERGWSNAAA